MEDCGKRFEGRQQKGRFGRHANQILSALICIRESRTTKQELFLKRQTCLSEAVGSSLGGEGEREREREKEEEKEN
jgi:hypothetical protein